ncbi:reverse transcriptase domain-containing protein [Tanacetum coccineum]
MTALIISISSNISVESVGSSFPRVILIGSISVVVPDAPEVGETVVASLAGVLELDTHSSSEAGPSESSLPPVSVAPMVSPFIWRSRVALRSSSPTTSIPEIPTAPILPAPSAIVSPSSEALTARKSVRPLPSHRLTLRYTSHHLDRFTSGSSSSHSSSDHSSSGHSITVHSLSEHTPLDTTDADSSTPPRFVHPLLARTPRSGDSFSESSGEPSRKRCMSLIATVTSSIHAMRALVPSRADLLPPRKRFRDSISPEDSVEEDIDTDVLEDIKSAIEVAVDRDVKVGIDADVVAEIDIPDAMHMPDVRIEDIETGQRELEARSLIGGEERASLLDQNMSITHSGMTPEAIEELVNRRVEEALVAYKATHGNGGNGNGGNRNPNENNRDARPVARECTYQDFMKCQPLNFKGMEGVVGLIRWFEKMETVFHISNCPKKYQVKYATCTLLNSAPTWWNSHKRTVGIDAAFAMSWRELMKLMAEVYCPRNEIQKMESELWNLTVKNNDLAAYTQRFQDLTMMCTKMVPEEEDRVEKLIGGLPNNI